MSETKMHLGLSQPLRTLVTTKFTQAQASQSLIFSSTELAVLHSKAGTPFQLRYCPALSKKPTPSHQSSPPSQLPDQGPSPPRTKKPDPFENPSRELLVARIPRSENDYTHNVVLNKFPVIPNHFILATRDNKPQTNLLEEADIGLSYACLRAWHDGERNRLFAFFNSGDASGASQPHRHLQFLSVEDMRGPPPDHGWNLLVDRMTTPITPSLPLFHDPGLPVLHVATPLSINMTPSQLHAKYILLLQATILLLLETSSVSAQHATHLLTSQNLASARIATDAGAASISYNLAMTVDTMALLPRRAETATIPGLSTGAGTGVGVVSVNGTILAGTLMVKNEAEWEAMKARPECLDGVLKQVGVLVGEGSRI